MTHMIHEELSRSIIGIAMAVLNELKPGIDEKLYERALVIELRQCGHRVEAHFFFQAEDGIRVDLVTGVQTCALPICRDRVVAILARSLRETERQQRLLVLEENRL